MPPLVFAQTQRFLKSLIAAAGGGQDLAHVPPVHADEMDSAVTEASTRLSKTSAKEARELGLGHLAGGHGELAMLDRAEPRDMTVDRHVVGRVGEDQLRRLASK